MRRIVRSRSTREASDALGTSSEGDAPVSDFGVAAEADRVGSGGSDAPSSGETQPARDIGVRAVAGRRIFDLRVKRPPPKEDESRRRGPRPERPEDRGPRRERPPRGERGPAAPIAEKKLESEATAERVSAADEKPGPITAPAKERPASAKAARVQEGSAPATTAGGDRPSPAKASNDAKAAPAKTAPRDRPAPAKAPSEKPAAEKVAPGNEAPPAKADEPNADVAADARRLASVPLARYTPPPDKRPPTPKEALRAKVAARAQAAAKARGAARPEDAEVEKVTAEKAAPAAENARERPAEKAAARPATKPTPAGKREKVSSKGRAPEPPAEDDSGDDAPEKQEKPGFFGRILGFFRGSKK